MMWRATVLLFLLLTLLSTALSFDETILSETDLFLEDEGSGEGRTDDLEPNGSGLGPDDEDNIKEPNKVNPIQVPSTVGTTTTAPDLFKPKEESNVGTFFSQPGILAAIICGAIVGLLCAILLVMFIVYRMRKKDEGSYVLEDSKRTSYGKSKEFFA